MTSDSSANYGTVLVIDDDDASRELMRRALTKEGFQVATAETGEEGARLAKEIRPTAIFLDVVLPGMNGWEVLNELKNDPDLASIPVTMVTMIDERNKGFSMGARDYLIKPVQRTKVVELARQFRPIQEPQSFLIVDDDPTNRTIMARQLRKRGINTMEAVNGADALRQINQNQPDIILLDLMMPEMDGFQLLDELRKSPTHRAIPVIVITAKDLSRAELGRINRSVRKVLQKGSYNQDELLHELRLQPAPTLQETGL